MFQRHLVPTLLLAAIALGAWAAWSSWRGVLNYQTARDKELARLTCREMNTSSRFAANLVGFTYAGPGEYRCDTTGLDDAHSVGRFAYNAMVVLDERNTVVKTGRASFTIRGYQNGELIFEVFYNFQGQPKVTLKGPYEGIEYTPTFSPSSLVPLHSETADVAMRG